MNGGGLEATPAVAAGVTRVSGVAARRLVEGILDRRCPEVIDPEVEVALDEGDVGRGQVRIGISFALAYPHGPLAATLAAVRATVAGEVARILGRPADRIDLVVTRLISRGPGPAPVASSGSAADARPTVAA